MRSLYTCKAYYPYETKECKNNKYETEPYAEIKMRFLRQKKTADLIRPYIQGKTLDVGCREGKVAKLLNLETPIIGIDIQNYLKEKIPFRKFDGQNIPFNDKEFKTVYCTFVLHHAISPEKLLKEIKRVGKRIIILEDKYDTLIEKISVQSLHLYLFLKWGMKYNLRGFKSKKNWVRLLEKEGFKITVAKAVDPVYPWFRLKHYLFVLELVRK